MSSLKFLLPILILVIFGAGYFLSTKGTSAEEEAVIKNTLARENFVVKVTATGELKAKRSQKVRGPQGLRQANIYQITISDLVPEGTIVKEGDYVATLERGELDTKLKDIQSELEKINTQLEQAKIDTAIELRGIRDQLINLNFSKQEKQLEVEQSKYEAPMVIQQVKIDLQKLERDYVQLESKYTLTIEKSEAQIAEINASLKQNQTKMDRYLKLARGLRVMAPKSGMVIYAKNWNGKVAAGSQIQTWDGAVVAELPDLTDMISKTFVNEVDISRVKKGQDVKINVDAFPDNEYTGTVIQVANIGEQLRNYDAKVFEVTVQVSEVDSILRPAMTTANEIITDIYEDVLSIPIEALQSDSLSFVFKENNGKIVRQEVITGISNNDAIIIEHGLEEGDVYYLTAPEGGEDLPFVEVDPAIKDEIRRKLEMEKKERQAKMLEKMKEVKDEDIQVEGASGGGFIIIN